MKSFLIGSFGLSIILVGCADGDAGNVDVEKILDTSSKQMQPLMKFTSAGDVEPGMSEADVKAVWGVEINEENGIKTARKKARYTDHVYVAEFLAQDTVQKACSYDEGIYRNNWIQFGLPQKELSFKAVETRFGAPDFKRDLENGYERRYGYILPNIELRFKENQLFAICKVSDVITKEWVDTSDGF